MPILTFPASPDGLAVDVAIGLSRAQTQGLRASGLAVPVAIHLRALLDTGTDITSVVGASLPSPRLDAYRLNVGKYCQRNDGG